MLELLFVFGAIALAACVVVCVLKLLVALLILPLKIAFWAAKGVVGLLLVIPLLALGFLVLTGAFPILVILLLFPVILVVAAFGLLVKLVF